MNESLRVAQRIARTESEGPGARYALWVQGCSIRCPDCCNPEMFSDRGGQVFETEVLAKEIIETDGIEGVTLLGGEPFEQAAALAALAGTVKSAGLSVMLFTGYLREGLERSDDAGTRALLRSADLLADGPFVSAEPGSRWRWLGSRNQRLHFMTERYSPDDPRFVAPNTIEIRIDRRSIEVSGWAPAAMSLGVERLRRR